MARRGASGIAVAGVGTAPYGRFPERDAYDHGALALRAALADAGLALREVDGLILNRIPDYQRFGEMLGWSPRYTLTTPGHGRFAGICIATAVAVLNAGLADVVALVYGNDGRSRGERYGGAADSYGSGGDGFWRPHGLTSPGAFHALMMRRHMALYGTGIAHLAAVAETFRAHAALNPEAVMRTPLGPGDHEAAPLICAPLRRLDYCLINDGGVALILTTAERAADMAQPPVHVLGLGQAAAFADSTFPPEDFWRGPMQAAGADAMAMCGLGPATVDGLMIYDNFTPTVLFSLEGFGLCAPGESGPLVASGALRLGGAHPSNTSGGHLSESYMQGWALNAEAVRQVRGQCGARQIEDCRSIQYMAAAPICSTVIYGADTA